MNRIFKYAVAATLMGALALAATSPSEARGGRNATAAIGFGVGALVGANSANYGYYGPSYYRPGYYSGYAYGPGPYPYEPELVYVQPAPRRAYRGGGGCWVATDTSRDYGYYGPCY